MTVLKRIVYTRAEDGGLSIVSPNTKEALEKDLGRSFTYEEYEQFVWERSIPENAINPRYIDNSELPTDRTFRNAWIDSGEGIKIHISYAKELALTTLREERNKRLDKLDKDMLYALENGDMMTIERIRIQKQKLRDCTDAIKLGITSTEIDASDTNIEALKKLTSVDEALKACDNLLTDGKEDHIHEEL